MDIERALAKLKRQEDCPRHRWLPREQIQTSHGRKWRTECALCGRSMTRGDYGDLSEAIDAYERAHPFPGQQ